MLMLLYNEKKIFLYIILLPCGVGFRITSIHFLRVCRKKQLGKYRFRYIVGDRLANCYYQVYHLPIF